MGSFLVLVSAVPGKEREVFDRLAKLPGLQQEQHLFGEQIALRLDDAQLGLAPQLATIAGVREARVYHSHDAWIVRRAPAGPGPNT